MKLSYNWLKELVNIDVTPQKLAELFTLKVAEIEGVEQVGENLDKVVVGEILEIRSHPSADKLQIAKVSVGGDILEIVCGAKNIKVGQKVPVALSGAVLPGNFKIKERKIRGVASEGMLASAQELGLVGNREGIMVLDAALEPGDKVAEVTGIADSVLEVDVLADRSYLLSHIGVAREIAAMRELDLLINNYGETGASLINKSKIANASRVQLMDPTSAPRYSTVRLSGLKIGPSPAWLSVRLQYLGLRPVNNLVDLTNYVMLELGQPMHAFDAQKLKGKKISVRSAKSGESIKTIEGEVKKLEPGMTVIADEQDPIAIAGVMGGLASEISNQTTECVVESANFEPLSIRKTAQKLKMRTEASVRFERGADPSVTVAALARLVELLPKAGLGEAQVTQLVDEYPAPIVRQPIRFAPALVEKVSGINIDTAKQIRIMQSLDLSITESVPGNQEELLVTPPSYRNDLKIPVDLVEEIIRLNGYDKIPFNLPKTPMVPVLYDTTRHWAKKIKNVLRGAGFTEVESYSFSASRELKALKIDTRAYLELQNPSNPEQKYLRGSLLPNALKVVKKNIASGVEDMRFYELGRIYHRVRDADYPFEGLRLVVAEVGKYSASHANDTLGAWNHLGQILESIIFHMGLDPQMIIKKPLLTNKAFHHGRAASLTVLDTYLGDIAEIHPIALARLSIDRRVTILNVDFNRLVALSKPYHRYVPVPAYPPVIRDLSLLIKNDDSVKRVMDLIRQAGGPILNKVELFDKFSSKKLGNEKSVAFHLTFLDRKKTLSDKDIEPLMKKISKNLVQKGYKIRS